MFLRFVYSRLKSELVEEFRKTYTEKVIARLEKVPGCLYCGLIVTEPDKAEGISLTLWETLEQQENYEKSGQYLENLNNVRKFLSDSSIQKVNLSGDLKLEYGFVQNEPEISSYSSIAQSDDSIPSRENEFIANLRLVTVKIQPDKLLEFRQLYNDKIIPELRKVKGCRFAVLSESMETTNELISITFWDSEADMDNYERGGKFTELNDIVKHTYTDAFRWKLAKSEHDSKKTVTGDDLQVKYYRLLTGKVFKKQ